MSNDSLQKIKQSFRAYMNGVTAASMREKGLNYRVIWGVSIQHLQEMAEEIRQNENADELKALSLNLWKEDIRECKILATLLMPHNEITKDEAREWVKTLTTQEMAEWLPFNLLRHLPFAKEIADEAINSDNRLQNICGQNLKKRIG